jgi:tetratricopeptide (TPR) repeat protein
MGRGYRRYGRGNMAGAIADSSKAIALNPNNPDAYWLRSLALEAQGKNAKAEKDLERWKKLEDAKKQRMR